MSTVCEDLIILPDRCKIGELSWPIEKTWRENRTHDIDITIKLISDISELSGMEVTRRQRTFSLAGERSYNDTIDLFVGSPPNVTACYTRAWSASVNVSENYTATDVIFHHIDIKNQVFLYTKYMGQTNFTGIGTNHCEFVGGVAEPEHYGYVSITDIPYSFTEETVLLVKGIAHTLKTLSYNNLRYTSDPLILVSPMPDCSLYTRCTDLVTPDYYVKFYDYCGSRGDSGGGAIDLAKARDEGGTDYFYPEWLQGVSKTFDLENARARYDGLFNSGPHSYSGGIMEFDLNMYVPDLWTGDEPSVSSVFNSDGVGIITVFCRDREVYGNYSWDASTGLVPLDTASLFGGVKYNDGSTFLKDNITLYPVSII